MALARSGHPIRCGGALQQHRIQVLQSSVPHGIARLDGGATEMRQQRDILQRQIAGIHLRLAAIDIQPGGSDMPGLQSPRSAPRHPPRHRGRYSPRWHPASWWRAATHSAIFASPHRLAHAWTGRRWSAGPSIRNERALSAPAASAISGNRPDQSCPLRVSRRTPAGSRGTIMRKPSSLISWIQSRPDGGRSAGDGRQGPTNAETRIGGDFSGQRPPASRRSARGIAAHKMALVRVNCGNAMTLTAKQYQRRLGAALPHPAGS